jgi:uncharacterized membrane protein YagU involved in acid resistance
VYRFIKETKVNSMSDKLIQAFLAGITATTVMTAVGVAAPAIGLPKMNPAEMLSTMLSVSIVIGYIIHFMIGIIFASAYVYWFNGMVRIQSKVLKGIVFGVAVFVFAQIMLWLIGMMIPVPEMGEAMPVMLASLIGHLVYGIVIGLVVPLQYRVKQQPVM